MKKIYKYENAIIEVLIPNEYNVNSLRTATETFLRKAIKERQLNGNTSATINFNKE